MRPTFGCTWYSVDVVIFFEPGTCFAVLYQVPGMKTLLCVFLGVRTLFSPHNFELCLEKTGSIVGAIS